MTKVKICGITTRAALDAALDAGADLIGLVFFPKSPRHLEVSAAALLSGHTRARGGAEVVALLVDPSDNLVDEVVAAVKPDVLQLHGHETPERVAEIRKRTGLRIMKAVPVADAADVAAAQAFHVPQVADIILFAAKPPADRSALPGGNGLSFDWRILEAVRGKHPFALAGGLTPDNVRAACELTGAEILDVSSGVESRPGEKDEALIRRFLREAKAANQT